MIIAPKQSPITQWRCEVIEDTAIERHDGLQNYLGSNTGEALNAAKHWGEGLPDAVDDIATSVSRYCFLEA